MKIIFTRGIQGSGKSTWAKQYCIENPDWVRVNRDDLRNMRGQYWLPRDEEMISSMEIDCIIDALRAGKNVVVDAMNLNVGRDIRRKMETIIAAISITKSEKVKHEVKDFTDVPLEECLRRNLIRPNSIDPAVIQRTWEKYLAPKPVVYEEDFALPHCVIVDIDGTLAKMNDRSPYEWDRVEEDSVNVPVKWIVDLISKDPHVKIIIFTGRDGQALGATGRWLAEHEVPYDAIHIRATGDTRKDSIVKKEIFEEKIRGRYYVRLVLDDRDQVVDMWRKELGLTCLQVDYGNF